jgi:hypothetical protein
MPSRVHLGLVLDEVALGQFSLQVLLFCWQYHSMAALYSLMQHLLDGRWGNPTQSGTSPTIRAVQVHSAFEIRKTSSFQLLSFSPVPLWRMVFLLSK